MIRQITLEDKKQWEKLYRDYADFSKVEISNKILQTVWGWLHNKNHEIECLVYDVNGKIVAFAHYTKMPRTLSGKDIGFLDDLFVDANFRGKRIGEKLLNKLKEIAGNNNWDLVRWISKQDNLPANTLYNRVAEKTTWDLYEIK